MDPLEEFEFKPLTEGLGFHRKKVDLTQEMKKSNLVKNSLTQEIPPTPHATIEGSKILKTPLPTKANTVQNSTSSTKDSYLPKSSDLSGKPSKDVIDELVLSFKAPNRKFEEIIDGELPQKSFVVQTNNSQRTLVLARWEVAPFLIDLMMVLALFLFGLIVSLYITKVDIYDFLFNASNGFEELVTVPAILFSMIISYTLITRIFVGGTLGEKVFDLQLGSDEDVKKYSYSFKVLLRMFVIISTGFVFMPLISLITGKDVAGKIAKLSLYKQSLQR